MYICTPGIIPIQNIYHVGRVDHNGAEFIGNKHTHPLTNICSTLLVMFSFLVLFLPRAGFGGCKNTRSVFWPDVVQSD